MKDVSSSYLKTEAQTWMSRKRKVDDAEDAASRRIVIHLGSEHIRIGRSSDVYPTTMPCALTRYMRTPHYRCKPRVDLLKPSGMPVQSETVQENNSEQETHPADEKPSLHASQVEANPTDPAASPSMDDDSQQMQQDEESNDPLSQDIERLRTELRAIMRQYRLRSVGNGYASAKSYNASVQPEPVLDHNDMFHIGWVEALPNGRAKTHHGDSDLLIGQEALRLDALSPQDTSQCCTPGEKPGWQLFRPWYRGMFNVEQYEDVYGPSAGVHAMLNDFQTIISHAISAPTSTSSDDDTLMSCGLGIPRNQYADYSVLLLIPDSFSRADIRALGTVFLTQMGFAALNVQTEGLCAMFGAGLSAACVVDVGATSIGISCIEEGLVLPETRIALAYGGRDISLFFGEVLQRSSFPYRELDVSNRLADLALLESLKERFATLLPNQVSLNLYDFIVRLPHTQAKKYALRLYDEPILAGLLLFHPEVISSQALALPRRSVLSSDQSQARSLEELEAATNAVTTNASLGGDEAPELTTDTICDVTPTLAMFSTMRSVPESVGVALGTMKPVAAAPNSANSTSTTSADKSSSTEDSAGEKASDIAQDKSVDKSTEKTQNIDSTISSNNVATEKSGLNASQLAAQTDADSLALDTNESAKDPAVATKSAPSNQPGNAPSSVAYASQTQRCMAAAALAAQEGIDIVSDASRTSLDQAVFRSLLASTGSIDGKLGGAGNEERLRKLANNVMCIGGGARLAGLGEALEARVSLLLAEHYTPSNPNRAPMVSVPANFSAPQATVIPPPRNMEPEHLAWKGLAVLAHLDSLQELWVYASDWDTLGYRALKEKSLFL
ncbi:actin-like protein arp8 [Malassezia yamatoensis]|uniref:Actin-like protein arp8 n=1 Tax=Malassezia yamatoensis TaxID=253288 RepID=A0AAJ5YZG1_9BASI|nr:actin-like protein arp8 [Malassezia yamatoensis]